MLVFFVSKLSSSISVLQHQSLQASRRRTPGPAGCAAGLLSRHLPRFLVLTNRSILNHKCQSHGVAWAKGGDVLVEIKASPVVRSERRPVVDALITRHCLARPTLLLNHNVHTQIGASFPKRERKRNWTQPRQNVFWVFKPRQDATVKR